MSNLHYKIVSSVLILSVFLSVASSQNLFSSFFRTNSYNRYVKNPMFTRNLVPPTSSGMAWPEVDYSPPLQQNQNRPPNSPNNSPNGSPNPSEPTNNFVNDFRLPPLNYGSFPATINGVNYAAASTSSVSISGQNNGQNTGSGNFEARGRNFDDINSSSTGNRYQNAYSDTSKAQKMRQNSKKLFENSGFQGGNSNGNSGFSGNSNGNSGKGKDFNNKYNLDSGLYMDDNIDNALGQILDSKDTDIRKPEVVYKHHNTHPNHHHEKYNQEKALNLKLEYGFKPLPGASSSSSPMLPVHPNVKTVSQQYPSSTSTSVTTPFSTTSTSSSTAVSTTSKMIPTTTFPTTTSGDVDHETLMELDEIYPVFDEKSSEKDLFSSTDFEPEAESSGHNNIYSFPKQSTGSSNNNHNNNNNNNQDRKSKVLDQGNASEQYYSSGDFRKLVHSPIEGEQSDLHRLAFAGIESFKPEADSPIRSSLDTIIGAHFLNFNSLSHYPDITNFKASGVECARNGQFCEYDSTYPKEYINDKIRNCSDLLDSMYTELPEDHSDFDGYRPFIQIHGLAGSSQTKNRTICDAERRYIRPSVIQDISGDYALILQSSYYFQQVPIETCSGDAKPCNLPLSQCGNGSDFGSRNSRTGSTTGSRGKRSGNGTKCVQKYRTQPLISMEHHAPGNQKSKVLDQGNASEKYYSSGDFRKLVNSPIEGEQSDLHRLAFASIESFKPEADSPIRSSLDTIIGAHSLNFNSLSHYPDITNFKASGVECARNGQFCEYDSTYPK